MTPADADVWKPAPELRSGRFFCPGGLSVVTVRIPDPRAAGRSIFYFSDLHIRTRRVWNFPKPFCSWQGLDWIEKSLHEAIELTGTPDFLIFGGDLVSESVWLDDAFRMLSGLPAKQLKLAVTGNWDRRRRNWIAQKVWRDGFERAGFLDLFNSSALCGNFIFFAPDDIKSGVPEAPGFPADPALYRCFLPHNPDALPYLFPCGGQAPMPDLTLCGHTHGGQWRVPGLGAIQTSSVFGKHFEYGPYRHRQTQSILYVSAGIGATWLPLRLFTPPEVLHIEFTGV